MMLKSPKMMIITGFMSALLMGIPTEVLAITLKEYAKKNPIKVLTIKRDKNEKLDIDRRDQRNNFGKGEKIITLSRKNISSIDGISKLKVLDGNKMVPITSIKNLHLFINYNELTEIPDEIGKLKNVMYIYFIRNNISEIPQAITEMTGLEGMYFTHNKLTEIPEYIYTMRHLRKLEVEGNQISYISPDIGNLTELIHLQLRRNNITELPATIGNLKKLRVCDFSDNKIKKLPENLGNAKIDYIIRLNGNPISTLPKGLFNINGNINIEDTNIDPKNYSSAQRKKFSTEKRKKH